MKLKTVQIKNFKSIRDSNEFTIDPKITALVGKNESGKTAVLQAITKLNPVDADEGDFDELDYPRHRLNEYQESDKYADALRTVWELDDEDVETLAAVVGPATLQRRTITIEKGYCNKLKESIDLDESAVVSHLVTELLEDERAPLASALTVGDLRTQLATVSEPTQRQKTLAEVLDREFKDDSVGATAWRILQPLVPKIAYFSEYLRMPGAVSVNELTAHQNKGTLTHGDKVFLALLGMINRTTEDLQKINEHERLTAELEGVSNRLTREIFRYWSQNRHLKVKFLFQQALAGDPAPFNAGWVVRTRIENTRHGVTTSFDDRSAGFVWFFSFLIWFSQVKKNFGENVVILLDEPALSLHAKAQADLLRYTEEQLATKHQVIYTTHSPFMIDPANLLRARTVEDVYLETKPGEPEPVEPDLGTKIGDDVLSTDRDTVFPLQAALGYEITQTLFVGEHSALVEGPSEILYFEWFRRKLRDAGRVALDRRWTLVPCGGIDKVPAFLSLFAGNRLHVAVITDLAMGSKKRVQTVRESKLLRGGHVLTMDAYAQQPEADVEDLIGRTAYIEIVARAYGLEDRHRLPATKPSTAPGRVVKEVEEFFGTLPPEVPEFDHYRPGEYLNQLPVSTDLPGLDGALNRFEALFKDLNAMLS